VSSGALDPAENQLRSSWFAQVYELADINLQRRSWLDRTRRNPHWSFIEFAESYPKQDQLRYAMKEGWLQANEYEILDQLRRALDAYFPPGGNFYDNAAVLDDPGWHAVVSAAEQARQQFLLITSDLNERAMLLGIS
jgi:hypothetical protein